jgi:hypothetical protein
MSEPKIKLGIQVIKTIGADGVPCVGIVLSQNAFVEIGEELHSGVALHPTNARIVSQAIIDLADELDAEYWLNHPDR